MELIKVKISGGSKFTYSWDLKDALNKHYVLVAYNRTNIVILWN